MKTKFNKIAKTAAVGIFFMALFFNVKVSLEDPFINIDNAALAQSNSNTEAICEIKDTDSCLGGSCNIVFFNGDGSITSCCKSCCPTGKSPICGSSGCECI